MARTTLVILIASLFVMAVGGAAVRYAVMDANSKVIDHWIPVERTHGRLLHLMTQADSSLRGYSLTSDREFLEDYLDAQSSYPDRVADVLEVVGDDELIRTLIGEEEAAGNRFFDEWGAETLESVAAGVDSRTVDRTPGVELFRAMSDAHDRAALRIAERIDDARDRALRIGEVTAVMMIAYVGVVLTAGILVVRRLRRDVVNPLADLRDTLSRLEQQDLSARAPVVGATEVRQLGQAVNQLAEFSQQVAADQQATFESNRLIRTMASSIRDHLDPSTVLSVAVDTVGPALDCDHAMVIQVTPEREAGEIVGEWRRHDRVPRRLGTAMPTPDEMTALVLNTFLTGEVLAIDDVAGDERLDPVVVEHLTGLGVRSLLLAQIAIGDEISGVLSVSVFGAPRPWTSFHRSMAAAVGRELARALRLADLYQRERDMVQQLRSLDQAKTDFISSVSHELRTPLTSILGYTELLVDGDAGELQEQQQSMLVVIDRNARRLLLLIDDLLTMSRIEADRLTITPTTVRIRVMLDVIAETMRPLADAAGITLSIEPVDPVATMWADERAVERVLLNLVSNAIKFTHAGGSVSVSAQPSENGVRIVVSDTGVGIPLDEQRQLFTRFFRSSESRSRAVQGTGLGLAIVRHIVEAHHGSVGVESQPGRGTDVFFTLPAPAPDSPSRDLLDRSRGTS